MYKWNKDTGCIGPGGRALDWGMIEELLISRLTAGGVTVLSLNKTLYEHIRCLVLIQVSKKWLKNVT